MNHESNSAAFETLKKIIENAKVAMLVTINDEGKLVSRPMQLQEVEFDGDLWFLTAKNTEKYDEIKHNDEVNVIIADKSYASLSGNAEIVDDIERKKKYWNKAYEKMFGMDYKDPNLTLIKVHIDSAEYWDTGATIKSVVNMVKKIVGNEDHANSNSSTNQTLDM